MDILKIPENEPIESKMVSKAIENAQKRVEAQYFQIRKRVLDMDDVMNIQRNVVYKLRRQLLEGKELRETIKEFMEDVADMFINLYAQADEPELWEKEKLVKHFEELTGKRIEIPESVRDKEELKKFLVQQMENLYGEKEEFFGKGLMRELEKMITLQILDALWRRHLHQLDRLREGIYLRGYGMRDPVTEYKKEAYHMFESFLNEFKYATLQSLFRVEFATEETQEVQEEVQSSPTSLGIENNSKQAEGVKKPRAPRPRKLKDRLKEKGLG
jgi:preprotein translocase subunit SecA